MIIAVGGLRADVQPASDTSSFLNGLLPMHLRNVHTSSTTAIPGVASLLTGKVPSAIPLCGHNATSKATPWCGDLPEQSRTLPEVLSLYGYKTALVTNGFPEMDSVEWRFGETLHLDSGERTNWTEVGERAANWWAQHSEPKLLVVLSNDLGLEHQAKNHSKWGVALQTVDNGAGKINQVEHPEALQSTYQQMANDTLLGAIQAFSFFQESPPPVRILTGLYGIDLGEGTPYPNQPIPTLSTNLLLDRTIQYCYHVSNTLFCGYVLFGR